jgi:NSS family neurotransmitter:Na+ symporter
VGVLVWACYRAGVLTGKTEIEGTMSEETGTGVPRERFGTRFGFVLAAAGSAVGLGNMWRFPYQTAENGGAAFVVLYLFMTFLLGVPIMTAEFVVGRRARRSPIAALRALAGRRWVPLGVLFVVTPLLILSYFSVIAGWTLHYALDALLSGFSPVPVERYAELSAGLPAVGSHLVLMALTVAVVMGGVRKGIERTALVLMPLLFLLLLGLAAWAATLDNAAAGYAFYLKPSLASLTDPTVIRQAASQAFLSLSVGMGVMITYASYLPRRESLGEKAILVSLADFSVAFVGGLVVFPVIFALGFTDEVGESTVGALFISLPGAFLEMGAAGRVVGFSFFLALTVAGLTSSVSLLEVPVAALMDAFALGRKPAVLAAGTLATALGLVPAFSQEALGRIDQVAGTLFVVAGALGIPLFVGWAMKDPMSELLEGASPFFRRVALATLLTIRFLVPPCVAVILYLSVRETMAFLFP